MVRAKVECVRFSQGKPEAAADAVRHLIIATQHLQHATVRLALVGGNPGTGKSTLARGVAELVGAQVISTDDVRRRLRDCGVITGEPGVLDSGLYSRANVVAVYQEALRKARLLLGSGHSVILDGTWGDPQMRACARRLAADTHSAIVEFRCSATVDVMADRIVARAGATPTPPPRSRRPWPPGKRTGTPGTGSTRRGRVSAPWDRPTTSGAARSENAERKTDANHHCQQHIVAVWSSASGNPTFAEHLVRMGITSVSVHSGAIAATPGSVAAAERRLLLESARGDA